MRSSTIARFSLLLLCAWTLQFVFLNPASALDVPQLEGRVNDRASILSPGGENQVEEILARLEQSDSTQIVVLTLDSLAGENLEQFSMRVAEQWRIGQARFDNGALLLIAVAERKMRIEVGYGLEGSLTDLVAGRIIRDVIRPYFQQGNFDQGIIAGVEAMAQAVRGEYTAIADDRKEMEDPFGMLAMLMFFFFFIGNILRRSKLASAAVGAAGAPLIGMLFHGFSLMLVAALVPVGIVFGLLAASLPMHAGRSGGIYTSHGRGGFGSSSGGFGGFSGGGGGFGGGGASGGW